MKSLIVPFKKAVWVSVRNVNRAAIAALAVVLVCIPVFSQTYQGQIQGGVFDQTGGAVVGAKVTVIDVARGIARPLTTDSAGQYVVLNLIPGTYTVRAEAMGFQTLERTNVLVQTSQNTRVDLTLQPGTQTQTITVNEAAPAIDTTDAVMGGNISDQQITALPVQGRNYFKLAALRPGAVIYLGGGEGNGTANATSFNGLKVSDNLYLIDGISEIASDSGSAIVGQGGNSILSVDAIQEVNTVQNPKAEYGWRDGGVVEASVRSGTNTLHGTAFANGRDQALDAKNYFAGITPVALEQFGGSAGGRLIKDKLFWFANFEGLRDAVGVGSLPTVPSDIALTSAQDPNNQLSMVNACTALKAASKTISPLSALMAGLNTTTCAVTAPSPSFENVYPYNPSASLGVNPNLSNTQNLYGGLVKMDYHMSDRNHFSGMFYISRQNAAAFLPASISNQFAEVDPNQVNMGNGVWVWTPNSTWVNEARGGYAEFGSVRHFADTNLPSAAWPTGFGMPTGVTTPLYGGLPAITIGGFSSQLGTDSHFGGIKGPQSTTDIVDHVSHLSGKHAIKFGMEFQHQLFAGNTFKNAPGSLKFTDLQHFLTGNPKSGSIFIGNAALSAVNDAWAVFAQDDWRVTTRLMLNLGLRYEYITQPTEQNNAIGNFYPNVNPATTSALGQAGGPFPSYWKPDKTEFSPRFGLAWDVKGNGKTVVRASTGLLWNFIPMGDLIDTSPFGANIPSIGYNTSGTLINQESPANYAFSPATLAAGWNLTGPIFPGSAPSVVNGVTYTGVTCTAPGTTVNGVANSGAPCDNIGVSPNLVAPRTAEWNLDIQRALTNNLTLDVAYVGNHSYDILSRNNVNEPPLGWGWNTPTSTLATTPTGAIPTSPLPGGVSAAAYCLQSAPVYNQCLGNAAVNNALLALETTGQTYFNQFPYLRDLTEEASMWYSDYDALQVTLNERTSHGLSFLASYTHERALSFAISGGAKFVFSQDVRNVKNDYGPGGISPINRLTFSTTYNVPGIKTPIPGQMLQGWMANAVVLAQGGTPWNPQDMTNDLQGTNQQADSNVPASQYWNFTGPRSSFQSNQNNIPCFGNLPGCKPYVNGQPPAQCAAAAVLPYAGNAQLQGLAMASLTNLGCYVQGLGVLTPSAYGTIGNAYRGIFHTVPYYNVDLSLFKDWKYRERYTAEFRTEIFNLFNRPDFAVPHVIDPSAGAGFGCSCQTTDVAAGDPVFGAGGARTIQFGLKLIF